MLKETIIVIMKEITLEVRGCIDEAFEDSGDSMVAF